MATPVIMPRQGQSVESCIITKWHKKKGDPVNVGDILFSYETDKAAFDEEAKVEGILLEVFYKEDDDVPVLTNVAVIGTEGENTAGFDPAGALMTESGKVEAAKTPKETKALQASETNTPAPIPALAGELKISPRARNLAQRSGVDPLYATPSGPEGRVIERDILALQESGAVFTPSAQEEIVHSGANPVYARAFARGTGLGGRITTMDLSNTAHNNEEPYQEVKLSNIRKVIAKAMHASLSSTAQLTLNTSFDATDILEFRRKVKENQERYNLENITLNDIIMYVVSRTLLIHKDLNAHFLEDKLRIFNHVHLGIATDTDRGLMVPTLFDADLKSLNQISREVKALVNQCRQGTINPDSLKGGTFTITNLGAMDIESFTPVLNPPQTGILGVNNMIQRVKEVSGAYTYYPAMGLSLTFDHRALDGAPAARFLKDLSVNLENFTVMLAGRG
ncbi:MAG TPA: dihydrolipoamide acetyltransferase family protein [Bacillota bacterium]|nr:dihydrolipoamide acetyltransferase family protein [Bacillota bacterium]